MLSCHSGGFGFVAGPGGEAQRVARPQAGGGGQAQVQAQAVALAAGVYFQVRGVAVEAGVVGARGQGREGRGQAAAGSKRIA